MPHGGDKTFLKMDERDNDLRIVNNEKSSKKARIIVRNLPFKNLTEKTLKDLFSEYGEVTEVKLLKKADGKFVGCGFVQFKMVKSAAKAIHCANQKEVNGRKIILDWALPKDTYVEKIKKLYGHSFSKAVKPEESDSKENDEIEFYIDKKPNSRATESESEHEENTENAEVKSESEDDDTDEEEEDEDEDEEDEEEEDKEELDVHTEKYGWVKREQKTKSIAARASDAEDGKTVFIRNVPFSATNDDLRKCVQNYGPFEYALICVDKLTEHSKGTAFVKFKSPESAKQCVRDSTKIYLDETPLTVTYALTKEHLEKKKSNKKVAKDNRNLYLVREGVIAAGTKAASGVSASDMSKRLQLEQWKSQILKNLNMFVSRTRLVIHNLPPNYDDEKLKRLFAEHGNPKAVIKEAKVMWEKKKFDSHGKHISKEVGFVSFADHEDALTALRNINNNPKIFTPAKRPIVAFSIENKSVLNQKQKRIEKSRAKLGVTIDGKLSKLNRKQRRFIRRRQKIIEERKARKSRESQGGKEGEERIESVDGEIKKRKNAKGSEWVGGKRQKVAISNGSSPAGSEGQEETGGFKPFTGVASKPGKLVKLRTRFNLKKQADIHNRTLKMEKMKRKLKGNKRPEPIRQGKQKKGKRKLADDSKLSKLISKHRESIQSSSSFKKWYET